MSLVERIIRLTFRLGEGAFGESGTNTVMFEGLRASARIVKAGGNAKNALSLGAWGISLSTMNRLATLGQAPTLVRRNSILVEAGDVDAGVAAVFEGTINNAWADFAGVPDVPFRVEATAGLFQAVKPIPASSFQGQADVAVIMAGLATQMGVGFENNGVSRILANPYYAGTAYEQAQLAARDAGIEMILDDNKLIIWPRLGSRGGEAPLIAARTGMIGYPSFTSTGIFVRTVFNRAISYGSKIRIESTLTPANEEWIVYGLDYDLEARVPNGSWFANVQAAPPGFAPYSSPLGR